MDKKLNLLHIDSENDNNVIAALCTDSGKDRHELFLNIRFLMIIFRFICANGKIHIINDVYIYTFWNNFHLVFSKLGL